MPFCAWNWANLITIYGTSLCSGHITPVEIKDSPTIASSLNIGIIRFRQWPRATNGGYLFFFYLFHRHSKLTMSGIVEITAISGLNIVTVNEHGALTGLENWIKSIIAK